jgi:hypothetical protein
MDMRFCINNLVAIRAEAGDFSLKDFSDYWAPDNEKTAPNLPKTFVPNGMVRGNNPLWASYYNSGETRVDADGSEGVDPNHPPYFRVSPELLGRMLHTFKKSYVDSDERRKTDSHLINHINSSTENLKEKVADAIKTLKDRKDDLLRKHDETIYGRDATVDEGCFWGLQRDYWQAHCDSSTVIARDFLVSSGTQGGSG